MNILKPANKDLRELTFPDYIVHPIWGFADDDGDEVMPVDYPGHLIRSSGGEALFVACEFTFFDGTKQPGVINVRMTFRSVYLLEFPKPDGKLFRFPINSRMEGNVTPAELATHLHKPVDQIFPINYKTPYVFKDGQKLIGNYNYPSSIK